MSEFVTNRRTGVTTEQLLRENAELKKQVEQFRRETDRRANEKNYFVFYRPYTYVMKLAPAIFLQDLMNRENVVRSEDKKRKEKARKRNKKHKPMTDDEGFFLCTVAYLQDRDFIVWDRKVQNRLINQLAAVGFVRVKKKGVPPRRWIKILRDEVIQAINEEDQKRDEEVAEN